MKSACRSCAHREHCLNCFLANVATGKPRSTDAERTDTPHPGNLGACTCELCGPQGELTLGDGRPSDASYAQSRSISRTHDLLGRMTLSERYLLFLGNFLLTRNGLGPHRELLYLGSTGCLRELHLRSAPAASRSRSRPSRCCTAASRSRCRSAARARACARPPARAAWVRGVAAQQGSGRSRRPRGSPPSSAASSSGPAMCSLGCAASSSRPARGSAARRARPG